MKTPITHQSVRTNLLGRIHSGEWSPGIVIPGEAELAIEFGCSRTTVNRALRQLADEGLVERRRKRGTIVTPLPSARTTLEIPIVRKEVEGRGGAYAHHILLNEMATAPASVAARLNTTAKSLLHLNTLHLSDGKPFMYEERWINPAAAPAAATADFEAISPNEWLVQEVPYSDGDISFSACAATAKVASLLETDEGAPLFLIERTTRMYGDAITTLKMYYPEGFRMTSKL